MPETAIGQRSRTATPQNTGNQTLLRTATIEDYHWRQAVQISCEHDGPPDNAVPYATLASLPRRPR
jgi:hypothetical protein